MSSEEGFDIEPGFALRGCSFGADIVDGGGRARRVLGGAPDREVTLRFDVRRTGDLVRLDLSLRNVGSKPVLMTNLLPLLLDARSGGALLSGSRCLLRDPGPDARALRIGWSNPIPPLPLGPRDREDRATTHPLLFSLLRWARGARAWPSAWGRAAIRMAFDEDALPGSIPGQVTSAWAIVLRGARGEHALAIGFGGFRAQHGRLRLDWRRGTLSAEAPCDGRPLAPGEEIAAEPLLLRASATAHDALAAWAAEAGRLSGARSRAIRYWCTWYAAPCDRIDERFVSTCLASLSARRAGVEHVVIDDGWQRGLGDWTETNAKFPRGLGALAAEILEAGFRPGIWLAPFVVSPRARLFAEHPDWMLRDAGGEPIFAGVIAGVGHIRPYYALDLTREEVRDHLTRTLATIRAAGFELFKVDFLTAGASRGRWSDPRATRATAYAAGMQALRRGAGDALLLGAIAPFVANAGLVDGQRVGGDVAFGRARWQTALGRTLGDWTSPGVRNALPGPLALGALDGRLFASDGDCIVARGLPRGLARAMTVALGLSCGVTAVGDDPRRGPGDALEMLAKYGFSGDEVIETRVLDLLDRPIPAALEARLTSGALVRADLRWARRANLALTRSPE